MPKRSANYWTTEEQYTFLESRYPAYEKIHESSKPKYEKFWAQVLEAWFKVFPEIAVVYPEAASERDLDAKQRAWVGRAIGKRIKQIKTWFRWQASKRAHIGGRRGRKRLAPIKGSRNKRALKPVELYSKVYHAKVQPRTKQLIDEMTEANGGKLPQGGTLICAKKAAAELYEEESPDVKAEIAALIEEKAKIKREAALVRAEHTPQQYLEAIQNAGDILGVHLHSLAEQTGWSFSVLMGGPQPNAKGEIAIASYHVGTTPLNSTYGMVEGFDRNVMDPYTQFLEDVYPQSVRDARTIRQSTDEDAASDDEGSEESSSDSEDDIEQEDENESEKAPKPANVIPRAKASTPVTRQSNSSENTSLKHPKQAATTHIAPTAANHLVAGGSVDHYAAPTAATSLGKAQVTVMSEKHSASDGSVDQVGGAQVVPMAVNVLDNARSFTQAVNRPEEVTMTGYPNNYQTYSTTTRHPQMTGVEIYSGATNMQSTPVIQTSSLNGLGGPGALGQYPVQSTMAENPGNYMSPSTCGPVPQYNLNDHYSFRQDTSMTDMSMSDGAWIDDSMDPLDTFLSHNPPPPPQQYANQLMLPQVDRNGHSVAQQPYSQQFLDQPMQPELIGHDYSLVQPPMRQQFLSQPMQPQVNQGQMPPPPLFLDQPMQPQAYGVTHPPPPRPQVFLNQPMQPQVNHDHYNLNRGPSTAMSPPTDQPMQPQVDRNCHGLAQGQSTAGSPRLMAGSPQSTSAPPQLTAGSPQVAREVNDVAQLLPDQRKLPQVPSDSSAVPPSVGTSQAGMSLGSMAEQPSTATSSAPPATAEGRIPLGDATDADRNATNIPQDARRSCRPAVPSKRAEMLNKIGENTKVVLPDPGKENIRPTGPPSWVLLANDHLLARDLGDDWKACVEGWLELEAKLGYTEGRSALPAVASRPDEWGKWVLKSRHGARRYDDIPFIEDSAELGIAIVKWWHNMQPDFRQSADEMPTPIYATDDDSDWNSIRKGGPSGLVSVLTLVVWWGRALLDRTQFQVDSTVKWNEMVLDLKECIRVLVATTSTVPRKRKGTSGNGNAAKHARA